MIVSAPCSRGASALEIGTPVAHDQPAPAHRFANAAPHAAPVAAHPMLAEDFVIVVAPDAAPNAALDAAPTPRTSRDQRIEFATTQLARRLALQCVHVGLTFGAYSVVGAVAPSLPAASLTASLLVSLSKATLPPLLDLAGPRAEIGSDAKRRGFNALDGALDCTGFMSGALVLQVLRRQMLARLAASAGVPVAGIGAEELAQYLAAAPFPRLALSVIGPTTDFFVHDLPATICKALMGETFTEDEGSGWSRVRACYLPQSHEGKHIKTWVDLGLRLIVWGVGTGYANAPAIAEGLAAEALSPHQAALGAGLRMLQPAAREELGRLIRRAGRDQPIVQVVDGPVHCIVNMAPGPACAEEAAVAGNTAVRLPPAPAPAVLADEPGPDWIRV